MDVPICRVTRSGKSYGDYVLGLRDTASAGLNNCTLFTVTMAPLFLNAMALEEQRSDSNVGDNEDIDIIESPPLRHSPRFSQQDGSSSTASSSTRPMSPASPTHPRLYAIAPRGSIKRARDKARSKARRLKLSTASGPLPAHRPRLKALTLYRSISTCPVVLESRDLPAGNWIGRRTTSIPKTWTLNELLGLGMERIPWNGLTSHMYTDSNGRGLVTLIPRLSDPTWMQSVNNVLSAFNHARLEGIQSGAFAPTLSTDPFHHRRGSYHSLASGVSFGGGSVRPGNLRILEKVTGTVQSLCSHDDVKRIAGFQSGMFAFYAPKLYNQYRSYLSRLYDHSPHLSPNFPTCSIFPACTFNLGPGTATVDHTDFNNIAYGLCAITALGNFDPTLGGHLVLFNLGLMFDFPAGTTIMLPSSVLRHGNTRVVGEGAQRMSFTQYCSGGLFRWVDYGFQTGTTLNQTAAGKQKKKLIDGKLEDCTEAALALFSTAASLADDRASVFGRKIFHTA